MGIFNSKSKAPAKIIVVFGTTGAQGGSVVQALIKDDRFSVRAVTRNKDSEKAVVLKELGAEVVTADLDDAESVHKAIEGAYGVFGVTNYWEYLDTHREIKQGKNIADACKAHKVQHLIWSSTDAVKDVLVKDCPHMDSKAAVEIYMNSLGLPVTSARYVFYCENLLAIMKPQKDDEGNYCLVIPMEGSPMYVIAVEHTGECIHQIFRQPKKFIGKVAGLSCQRSTIEEYADILNKHLEGYTFKASKITPEQFSQLGFPGADDLSVMFEYFQKKLVSDIKLTKSLNPNMPDFEEWVKNNKEALVKVLD